jgi:hypothetical protein
MSHSPMGRARHSVRAGATPLANAAGRGLTGPTNNL